MTARDFDIYRRHKLGVTTPDLARIFKLTQWQVLDILERQRAIAAGRKVKGKVIPMPRMP